MLSLTTDKLQFQGKNSLIKYTLRDAQTSLPFMIEEMTGWIKTSTALDREVAGSYRFLVEAQDEGAPSLSALATIQVSTNQKVVIRSI
jgi:hypothetical protein